MVSVGWSNKRKPLKLRHYDISRTHFQGTAQRLIYVRLPAKDRQKYGEDKVDMGTLGFDEPDVKNLPLLNRVFGVGTDQTGQYMDSEHDLRHAPLIINES